MACRLSNGHVTDDVTWPWKVILVNPKRLERNISKTTWARDPTIFGIRWNISPKLLELESSNLVCGFVLGMPSGRTNNFPESGCGLGHVTPTIFGSTVGYPSNSLASCLVLDSDHAECLRVRDGLLKLPDCFSQSDINDIILYFSTS